MAAKLKHLKIRKVDFVDEGANPDAHIGMMKRKEADTPSAEKGSKKETGNVLKKLLGFIGKAAGMDQNEIDSAMDEIQKGDSISFSDKINEANNRRIADEMWDICFALQSSLYSILGEEEIDGAAADVAMRESLDEFYAAVQEAITKWASGKSSGIIKKNMETPVADIEIMKAAVERLNQSIEKAGEDTQPKEEPGAEGADNNGNPKGGEKEVKIDKSKLTDAERAFLESIEKRYGEENVPQDPPANIGKAGKREKGTAKDEEDKEKEKEKEKDGSKPPVKKSVESGADREDDIYKGLHPAVRAELESLKKFREDAEDRELAVIAKKYAIIGKKEDELVPLFKSLRAAGGTAYNDMIAVLDQAVAAVESSGAFSEIGKSGHGSAEGGAWAEADAKAAELMKSKSGLSKAQALDEVFMANPGLAAKCEKEG